MQDKNEISKLYADLLKLDQSEPQVLNQLNGQYNPIDNECLCNFVLRHLTFKYTCPLTVLYGVEMAGIRYCIYIHKLYK